MSALPEAARRATERVAAFRRPGMLLAIYLYRSIAAVVLSLPLAIAVGGLLGGYPRGDAELFDPGGVVLLEVGRLLTPAAIPLGLQAGVFGLILAFVGLVPLAMLIDALGIEGRLSPGDLLDRATRRLGTFSLLFGVAAVAELGVAMVLVLIGEKSLDRVVWSASRHKDIAQVLVWCVGVLVVVIVGVAHDLARVYVVRRGFGFYAASACALRAMQRTGPRALFAYAWRGAVSVGGIAFAVLVAARIGVRDDRHLLAVAAVNQGALLLAVVMRGSWLAAAVRLSDRVYEGEALDWTRKTTLAQPPPVDVTEPAEEAAPDRASTNGETPGDPPSPR